MRTGGDGTFELAEYTPGRDFSGWAERNPKGNAMARNAFRELEGVPQTFLSTTDIHPEVFALAQEIVEGAKTDREKADRLRTAIAQRVQYNLRATATPAGMDPVYHFLFVSKEGYCDLYASAMVHLSRAAGLPARYVQGFLGDPQNVDRVGRTVVLERDYHAWAELLFEDAGWVIFDATEGTRQVAGGERGSSLSNVPFWQEGSFRQVLDFSMLALVGLAAGILFVSYRKRQGPKTRKSEVERAFIRFMRTLERGSGRRKVAGESPREYVDAATEKLNGEAQLARQIELEFERAFYAPDGIDDDSAAKLIGDVRELETALKRRGRN